MYSCFRSILFLSYLATHCVCAQVFPAPDSHLSYTDVQFRHPAFPQAVLYHLFLTELSHQKAGYTTLYADSTEYTLVKNLHFGKRYAWHYTASDPKGKQLFRSETYHFYIDSLLTLHNGQAVATLQRGKSELDYYLLVDGVKSVFSPLGREVWVAPARLMQTMGIEMNQFAFRDLRLTPEGTFTCLITNKADGALEFDKEGNILWRAPLKGLAFGDDAENYHHDFRKLPNGNYMVLSESKQKTLIPSSDIKMLTGKNNVVIENGKAYNISTFGTLIEYDTRGSVLWAWNSADFFNELVADGEQVSGTHLNAFYPSLDGKFVYLGFRDVGMMLKVDKQTKKVVATYGTKSFAKHAQLAQNRFAFQHSIEQLENGNLIIYNNDSVNEKPDLASSLVEITDKGAVVRTFSCKTDNSDDGKTAKYGSADELPNHNILLGIGANGKLCELSPTEMGYKLLKETSIRQYNADAAQWNATSFYRSHYALSLYPYAFSTTLRKSHLRLANEGELEDNYTYVFLDENAKAVGSPRQLYAAAGGYAYIPITANKHKKIEIRSANVPYKPQIVDLP